MEDGFTSWNTYSSNRDAIDIIFLALLIFLDSFNLSNHLIVIYTISLVFIYIQWINCKETMKKTVLLCLILLICDALGIFKHEHGPDVHDHDSCEMDN